MDRRRSDGRQGRVRGSDLSAKAGADALGGILSVVDHGGAQGTNKYGLLLVLIDIAQEVELGEDILLDELALRSLELYWPMSLDYGGRRGRLRQISSSNRSVAALSVAEQLRATADLAPSVSWSQAQQHFGERGMLDDAVRQVGYKLWREPIPRVQSLPGSTDDFLFSTFEEPRRIRFREAAQEALVRHGPLLRELIQHRFVSFVSAVPRNDLADGASSIHHYLFPTHNPSMPPRAMVESILDCQGGVSPYTGRPVKVWHVDHVVPWSRVQLSMVENFVIIPSDENLAKGNYLLAPEALEEWADWRIENINALQDIASRHDWRADSDHQLQSLQVQYLAMRPGDIIWGPAGVRPASYLDITNVVTVMNRAVAAALSLAPPERTGFGGSLTSVFSEVL